VLSEIARILKPGRHAALVVCPSNIRQIEIEWHVAFRAIGERLPIRLTQKRLIPRTLDDRRSLLPYMNAGSLSQRMRTEYVQVLKKAD
jgi:hypothetical protein